MEGLGKAGEPARDASIFGYNKSLPPRKYDPAAAKKLLAEAGYPNGFKVPSSFTQDRLPGDRQVGTSIAQMLAAIGIDATANAQPAAVFFPARTRGEFSMSMSGWGTLTGEAHYTLSSLAHSNDKDKKMGAFNVLGYNNPEMDKLLQDAAVEMDEAKRRAYLEEANALVAKDRQRLPIVAVGSAWAMQKGKVTISPRVDEDTLAMDIKPASSAGSMPPPPESFECPLLPSAFTAAAARSPEICMSAPTGRRPASIWPTRCARLDDPQGRRQRPRRGRGRGRGDGGQPAFQCRPRRGPDRNGEHELDSSIMDGATLAAGAVCAVRRIRNPVKAARAAVMEKSDCVLMARPCGR
jgi:hypothetical protein